MFQKLFSLLLLLCVSFSGIYAQNQHFSVGQTYKFVGSNEEETADVTLSVIFDEQGVASISRAETANASAKGAVHRFTKANSLSISKSEWRIADPKAQLWLISFDPNTPSMPMRAGAVEAIRIDCPCKGKGTCEPSAQQSNQGSACVTCVTIDCNRCSRPIITNVPLKGSSFLVLEATSISFE